MLSDDLVASPGPCVFSVWIAMDVEGEVQYCQRIKTGYRTVVSAYAISLSLNLLIWFSVLVTR